MAGVEALVLGLDPELVHLGEELSDRVEAVLEDRLEDEVLAPPGVLRVVHRAHVQRGDVGPKRAQVLEPLLDRHADRAGRVVDDHVVDLGPDRLGDRLEVLDLVGRRPVRGAGVDVDLRGALVDRAPRLGRVLLGRVGDRRALVAVRDRARDRVADDHRVLEAAHQSPRSTTICFSSLTPPRSPRTLPEPLTPPGSSACARSDRPGTRGPCRSVGRARARCLGPWR